MLSGLLALAGRALADSPYGDDETNADDAVIEQPVELDELDLDEEAIDGEETARSPLDAGAPFVEESLAASSGLVDATSLHDLEARHHRPSRWGRLDLALTWRRIDKYDEPSEPSKRHEILLVATWRN